MNQNLIKAKFVRKLFITIKSETQYKLKLDMNNKCQNINIKISKQNDTGLETFRDTRDNMSNSTYSTASTPERTIL